MDDFTLQNYEDGRIRAKAKHVQRMGSLKKRIQPPRPTNLEEWGQLPLWRPHINHVKPKVVRCSTLAQPTLRDSGFVCMTNVWQVGQGFIPWPEARRRGAPLGSEAINRTMIANLKNNPDLKPPIPHRISCLKAMQARRETQSRNSSFLPDMLRKDGSHAFPHNTELERTLKRNASTLMSIARSIPAPTSTDYCEISQIFSTSIPIGTLAKGAMPDYTIPMA